MIECGCHRSKVYFVDGRWLPVTHYRTVVSCTKNPCSWWAFTLHWVSFAPRDRLEYSIYRIFSYSSLTNNVMTWVPDVHSRMVLDGTAGDITLIAIEYVISRVAISTADCNWVGRGGETRFWALNFCSVIAMFWCSLSFPTWRRHAKASGAYSYGHQLG